MKIITSSLFLTFMGALYVKSADGRVPVGVRYATVKFKDYTRYHGFLALVWPHNRRLDHPNSRRPLWMSLEYVHRRFDAYYIYMEMSHQRRYTSEALQYFYGHPSHRPGLDLPETAIVFFADHKYSAKNFVEYDCNLPHPDVADDDTGGRIYIKIKNTRSIYYAILKYIGVSREYLPNVPEPPAGYHH